jgi:hypothetical protein
MKASPNPHFITCGKSSTIINGSGLYGVPYALAKDLFRVKGIQAWGLMVALPDRGMNLMYLVHFALVLEGSQLKSIKSIKGIWYIYISNQMFWGMLSWRFYWQFFLTSYILTGV